MNPWSRVTIIPLRAQDQEPDSDGPPAVPKVPPREIPAPFDEAELTLRLSAGDADALNEVVRWLWEPLASYAYRLVGDRDMAMDIAQEACLRLWEGRGREVPRSLQAYLFRVTRNRALDQLKTRRTRHRLLKHYDSHRPGAATPEDVLEGSRLSTLVDQAIRALPERRREVFVLAYLHGLSYAEVGEVMGISHKTVQHQMSAALAQLRDILRPLIRELRVSGPVAGTGRD